MFAVKAFCLAYIENGAACISLQYACAVKCRYAATLIRVRLSARPVGTVSIVCRMRPAMR